MRRAVRLIRVAAQCGEGNFAADVICNSNLFAPRILLQSYSSQNNPVVSTLIGNRSAFVTTASTSSPPSPTTAAAATPTAEITNAATFNSAVALSNTVPVVLIAYAQGTSSQFEPLLQQAAAPFAGKITLAKMHIDNPALAPLLSQLQIVSVPTLILLYGGRAVDIKEGGIPPPTDLENWFSKAVNLAEKVGLAAAASAADAGDQINDASSNTAAAAAVIDPKVVVEQAFIAARSPGAAIEELAPQFALALQSPAADGTTKSAATAGLALCAALDGDFDTAKELLSSAKSTAATAEHGGAATNEVHTNDEVTAVEAFLSLAEEAAAPTAISSDVAELQAAVEKNAQDVESLYALALQLAVTNQKEEALAAALLIVRRDREWHDQAGKRLVLRIADAFGEKSEFANKALRRLSNLWFI